MVRSEMERLGLLVHAETHEYLEEKTNKSAWVREAIAEKRAREEEQSVTDYNELDIRGDERVNPTEADFSNTDTVKTTNRPAVLAAIVRYKSDNGDDDEITEFGRDELISLAMSVFGVRASTAKGYVEQLVRSGELTNHVSCLMGTDAYNELRHDIADHWADIEQSDVVRDEGASHYYRHRNYVTELAGRKGGVEWLKRDTVYYTDRFDAVMDAKEYLWDAAGSAPEEDQFGDSYAPQRVFSRLVAESMKEGFVTRTEAAELLERSPWTTWESDFDGVEDLLRTVEIDSEPDIEFETGVESDAVNSEDVTPTPETVVADGGVRVDLESLSRDEWRELVTGDARNVSAGAFEPVETAKPVSAD